MTPSEHQTRRENMILGALVADAAAMGLHWIYDQDHIKKIAPDTPEFTPPLAQNYEGVMAFFAHPNRANGAQSQYGEQALVMLRTLAAQERFIAADFAEAFRAHFGYGGAYVGYIDHATRDTLDNFRRFEDTAADAAAALGPQLEPRLRQSLAAAALPLIARLDGDPLTQAYQARVEADHEDADIRAFATELLGILRALPRATGAVDVQLPAIAKLPPLVALLADAEEEAFDQAVAAAVQTTSDHPIAADYGLISARMIRAAITDTTTDAVASAAQSAAQGDAAALVTKALSLADTGNAQVTAEFGMACDLPYGVPSALHNITTAPDFTTAIRRNIYAGGDTCGRAMLVGAVAGAIYGVGGPQGIPQDWIDRLTAKEEVTALMKSVFA